MRNVLVQNLDDHGKPHILGRLGRVFAKPGPALWHGQANVKVMKSGIAEALSMISVR